MIIHAAALKHVPSAEYNPTECIQTNVMWVRKMSLSGNSQPCSNRCCAVDRQSMQSINLNGASKLASNKVCRANNLAGAKGPRFSVVRYGIVFGSRGSVVPLFRKLIAEGATSLPITHPEMTRFWISLATGVEFVLSVALTMRGGEICVPKSPA